MNRNNPEKFRFEYVQKVQLLKEAKKLLEEKVTESLKGIPHIDRIYFRVKDDDSFAKKSVTKTKDGKSKYDFPHLDIEDQIAGRILVLFRRDIEPVGSKLLEIFNRAEHVRKAPDDPSAFAYESDHFIFILPPDTHPSGWAESPNNPGTFEIQIRTLFMHAWAEPEHEISYKSEIPLTIEDKKKLAWAASNAWGGDAIFEQILDSLAQRTKD